MTKLKFSSYTTEGNYIKIELLDGNSFFIKKRSILEAYDELMGHFFYMSMLDHFLREGDYEWFIPYEELVDFYIDKLKELSPEHFEILKKKVENG